MQIAEVINTDDHDPTQSLRSILNKLMRLQVQIRATVHAGTASTFSNFPYDPSHRKGIYDRGWVGIAALAYDWLKGIVSI